MPEEKSLPQAAIRPTFGTQGVEKQPLAREQPQVLFHGLDTVAGGGGDSLSTEGHALHTRRLEG